jgi:hypothetical protein
MLQEPTAQSISLQSKALRRQRTSREYEVYRAALEWDLTDPIVIDSRDDHYRRINHAINETTALTISIVVIGKKNLNPGRSMTMSPGR